MNIFLSGFKHFVKLHILGFFSNIQYFFYNHASGTVAGIKLNTFYFLRILTYDNSGQAVHPDIYYDKDIAPPYILAFTPYPFSMQDFENPSILISDDGINFHEEKKGINPLVPAPVYDHNDDPDLFYDNGTWNILYLETLRPEKQNLVLLSSKDRILWGKKVLHTANLLSDAPGNQFILSPSFISFGDKRYIFYVHKRPAQNVIEYVNCDAEYKDSFENPQIPVFETLHINPWHIDVIRDENVFYMLVSAVSITKDNGKKYDLYIARSTDLRTWKVSGRKVINNAYRSSGYVDGSNLIIYFSRQTGLFNAWRIGIYKIKLADYF